MRKINLWFVGWWTLFILNILVGVADWLDNGYSYQLNATAVLVMIVLKVIR